MEEPLNPLNYPTYPTILACEAACTSVVSFCVQDTTSDPIGSSAFVCQLNSVLFALVISAAVALGIIIPLSFVILYVMGCFSASRRPTWRAASEELKAINNTTTKLQPVPSDDSNSFPAVKKGSMMVVIDGKQKQLQWHESVSVA
ncbi:hypothetical protein PFISCL1PPCAC_1374 [Pristionchus fissidentatus]|uniref:Uncharacterized protein n=1 Tax=Pristionchus fissidentatus TaxID=1538716 RepID=A0AAV5UUW9_9BILA|nr:hypothetical protein PFISCL1PPCAC_1374 [Pristionchus fissidentatus]